MHDEASDLAEEARHTSRRPVSCSCASQTQQSGVCNFICISMHAGPMALLPSQHSALGRRPYLAVIGVLQTIQYSVLGVLLVIAGLHTLFFRGARYSPLGCQQEV